MCLLRGGRRRNDANIQTFLINLALFLDLNFLFALSLFLSFALSLDLALALFEARARDEPHDVPQKQVLVLATQYGLGMESSVGWSVGVLVSGMRVLPLPLPRRKNVPGPGRQCSAPWLCEECLAA